MVTATVPPKLLRAEEVMVIALLVVPALRESEPGETAREKSGVGLGGEPPQVVRRKMEARAAARPTVLAKVRMGGAKLSSVDCTARRDFRCSRGLPVPTKQAGRLDACGVSSPVCDQSGAGWRACVEFCVSHFLE